MGSAKYPRQDAISASPIKQLPPQIYRRPSLTSQFGWSSHNGNFISANIELTYPYEPPQFPAFKAVSATPEIIQEHGVVKTHEFAASTYHEKAPFILEDLTDLPINAALFAIVQYADGYIMNVHIGSTDSQGFPSH